jgi:hypothetical protein
MGAVPPDRTRRQAGRAGRRLAARLSDGYVAFDDDLLRKLPGPVVVKEASGAGELPAAARARRIAARKPYFIGIRPWTPVRRPPCRSSAGPRKEGAAAPHPAV